MALHILKTNEMGIPLSYHRINMISQITNDSALIEVASYFDEAQRQKEREAYSLQSAGMPFEPVYADVTRYLMDYIDGMTCTQAYDYLKTLPEFAGATDILEDDDADL